jgi:hypothetical protein
MSTPDPTTEIGRATAGNRPVRTGVARTLARGRLTPRRVADPAATNTASTGAAATAASPMGQDFSTLPQSPQRPANSAAGDASGIRRSQTQMAAILARAVAQGQRNL